MCDTHVDGVCTVPSLQADATVYEFSANGVCEDTGPNAVERDHYVMCEFRGGNTAVSYCSNRNSADGVVPGGWGGFWSPCGFGSDCTDCGTRCNTGASPNSADMTTATAPWLKVQFLPAAVTMRYGTSKRVVVQLRDALEPFQLGVIRYVRLEFSTTTPGITITPSSVQWISQNNHTVGRSVVIRATQPIAFNMVNNIQVTLNTNDVGYYGFPPTFSMATVATASPPPPPGNPPGLPPMPTFPTGCTIQQAWTRRMNIDQCYDYYHQYNLQTYGGFQAPEGNLTDLTPALYHLGICYWDAASKNMMFRSARYLQACISMTCFCPPTSSPPPPPPPGVCGIDHCDGCLNPQPEGVGGYCIAPGNCNCSPDGPNRCWHQQGSQCVFNAQSQAYCCTEV